jgi:prepilin-type N-terminal cleavage/methylation domain-containing protein
MNGPALRTRRGFTLVELLVVIAIIGVLMALLLPALSSARAAANSSGSASNLSGFGRGFELYANSNSGAYNSGAFDHLRDGDIRQYGWVADLIGSKVSQPGKALDLGSRTKVSITAADYMGATSGTTFATGTTDGRWATASYAASSGTTYFGSGAAAKEVWNQGFNTNYATTWHFSRGDPTAVDGYAPGTKGISAGDGPMTQNHINQGNTTAARVALMGPARADATVLTNNAAKVMTDFTAEPIVKANDPLAQSFTGGMTITGTVTGAGAGVMIHEFTAIEPLHQPTATGGKGGHAPVLFADLHVEKVQDKVKADGTTGGDGFLGNGASLTIAPASYEEVADQMWTRRLRTMTSGTTSIE